MATCFMCGATNKEDARGGWVSIKDKEDNVWSACPRHATQIPHAVPIMLSPETLLDSDVPWPLPLTPEEGEALSIAIKEVVQNALDNATKRPKMTTLC